ncbi:MAG: hypothetical protein ACFHVJ_13565 [Aestuariibacter sp.]
MPTNLVISNKLLSLRGRMEITDENGILLYDAVGELALFSPTWRITKGQEQVASVKRKTFSFAPTYFVKSKLGDFVIKRKVFSLSRRYHILGGPFNGAVISGNLLDLKFNINHGTQTLARASGNVLSLRDRHNIEVTSTQPEAELMTVIAMVTLNLDKKSDSSSGSIGSGD